jgi:hypothetical protein
MEWALFQILKMKLLCFTFESKNGAILFFCLVLKSEKTEWFYLLFGSGAEIRHRIQ